MVRKISKPIHREVTLRDAEFERMFVITIDEWGISVRRKRHSEGRFLPWVRIIGRVLVFGKTEKP